MKVCSACKVAKPLEDFSKVSRNKDGRHGKCKHCYSSYMKEWSRANSEVVNARVARYFIANRERLNAERKQRRLRNLEHSRQKSIDWQNKNPEKAKLAKSKNNAKRRGQFNSESFAVSEREISKLYKAPCFYCQSKQNQTIDHLLPLSRGGNHSIGNLVTACKQCNSIKNRKTVMEFKIYRMQLA